MGRFLNERALPYTLYSLVRAIAATNLRIIAAATLRIIAAGKVGS
jgi:hypothetical protein